ncbi:MAG TPA: hypothetical protein VMA34_07865 [Terracidiphilus sp.]|nr:hypothetical protein [Terracidiphilus sp.]
MFSFLLGSAAGLFVLSNRNLLCRTAAWIVVQSEARLETASKLALRGCARTLEDVQDIFAEASSLRDAERLRDGGQQPSPDHHLTIN